MKMPSTYLFGVLFSVLCTPTIAQTSNTKQVLYADFPTTISVENTMLSALTQKNEGNTVAVSFLPNFTFNGTVISSVTKYKTMHTVIIRSMNDASTTLEVTQIEHADKTISYAGRILNSNAADGYQIKKINDAYFLQKFETDKILEPCKF